MHPKHIAVKIIDKLPMKSFMPEPQNNPYWIVKEAGHIHVYRGCGKDLNEFAVGRWEVEIEKEMKYLCSKADAYYNHVNIKYLRIWRTNLSLNVDNFKAGVGVTLKYKMEQLLFDNYQQ